MLPDAFDLSIAWRSDANHACPLIPELDGFMVEKGVL